MSRTYLILFNDLPIDKTSVKRGENAPQVVTAARSVNVALFLSKDLRRDVTISLGMVKESEWNIISFPGATLRRVSPDERSISFFLLKAFEVLDRMTKGMTRTLDNGIVIQRLDPIEYLQPWGENIYLAKMEGQDPIKSDEPVNSIYIYDIDDKVSLDGIKWRTISRPKTPERFILDINVIYDP